MRTFAGYSVSSNDLKSMLLYLTVSKDAGIWVSLCTVCVVVHKQMYTGFEQTFQGFNLQKYLAFKLFILHYIMVDDLSSPCLLCDNCWHTRLMQVWLYYEKKVFSGNFIVHMLSLTQ